MSDGKDPNEKINTTEVNLIGVTGPVLYDDFEEAMEDITTYRARFPNSSILIRFRSMSRAEYDAFDDCEFPRPDPAKEE